MSKLLFMLFPIFIFQLPTFATSTKVKKILNLGNLSSEKELYLPKLYEVESDSATQNNSKDLLPDRVYLVYNESKKGWLFAKTDAFGNLQNPSEYLHYNSILKGKHLGAKRNPYQNYKLTEQWKWVPTNQEEEYFFWVLSKPQVLKRVTFVYAEPWAKH